MIFQEKFLRLEEELNKMLEIEMLSVRVKIKILVNTRSFYKKSIILPEPQFS